MNRKQPQRLEYTYSTLSEEDLNPNPFEQFRGWYATACEQNADNLGAMCLSTVSKNGTPDSRIVLLKDFDESGFTFYTNYDSRKGTDIGYNPNVSLVFFWPALQQQVRISGRAKKTTEIESDRYFNSRPRQSQIGAIASPQSKPLDNREQLEHLFRDAEKKIKDTNPARPPYWGGYRIKPVYFEFWQGRESRLNDRFAYSLTDAHEAWHITRLAP